jgi:CRISPR-associated protein Cas5t
MITMLEVRLEGWTATPRMPFILSGNAICMPTPSYSMLLGLLGCCLGRPVGPEEVRLGFRYQFDGSARDVETRHRLVNDSGKIKAHAKGTDAHVREFHVRPRLTIWLDRLDWEPFFRYPVGAPVLGRSQDLLSIRPAAVRQVAVQPVESGKISGCMLPFDGRLSTAGQLLQLAEAYRENDTTGSGRTATATRVFLAIPPLDSSEEEAISPISYPNLYQTADQQIFYLHDWLH